MTVEIGELDVSYSARGIPSYRLEMWHHGLKKHRVIRGSDTDVIQRKAELQAEDWNEKWELVQEREAQRQAKEHEKELAEQKNHWAEQQTEMASDALSALEGLLEATLDVDDTIDWEQLKSTDGFGEPKPTPCLQPSPPPPLQLPPEPSRDAFSPKIGLLDRVIPSRKERKVAEAAERFEQVHTVWEQRVQATKKDAEEAAAAYDAEVARRNREYEEAVGAWQSRRQRYEEEQRKANEAIDRKRGLYEAKDPEAVHDYCDMVLANSRYPDWMPGEWELDYNPENATLIVEYALPSVDDLPTLSQVRYVKSRDEFVEKHISEAQLRRLYDSVLYQIALRTVHELYEADTVQALESVVFNGRVTSVDRSTGHETTACILSLQTSREEFLTINLAAVDPKSCFKSLKGVGSSKLHSLTAVAPIVEMRREDGRFVSAREVANTLDDSTNLAAMDWEDFEHLIRELFEKEFGGTGGEVKVTQASRDGGVDAVAFDPDPIRGGKIVIQAKRYTNTVGVAAVRDLYGTVVNEGANRGILVTTSDYGPDAYSFAKDKPLALLNGANLLHLLQKHGQRAKIDIEEARQLRE